MIERLILTLVSLIMLYLTTRKGSGINLFLTGGLTVGILVTWIPFVNVAGVYIYTLFTILTLVYITRHKEMALFDKFICGICGVIVLLMNVLEIIHFPISAEMKWIFAVPVIAYFFLVFDTSQKFLKKHSYVTILAVDSLIRFLKIWI